MAAGLNCDNHDDAEAKFIIGNADTGEQSFFCPVCVGTFGLVMALAVLDPADVKAAADERLNAVASNGAKGAGDRPAPKSAKKKAPKQRPAEPAPERLAEESPAIDD